MEEISVLIKRMASSQSAAFLSYSLRDSQINASLFATTLTLTLISSQLVERDIFLLKPFPCS